MVKGSNIRSGRKLDRPGHLAHVSQTNHPTQPRGIAAPGTSTLTESDGEDDVERMVGKSIYIVSDGTGWTVEHSVNAAFGQFEHCLIDRGCPVNTHLFSGIDDAERLMDIVKQAAKEDAKVVYTLAESSMAESAKKACKLWGIPSTDMLGPITEAIASHLGIAPSGLPGFLQAGFLQRALEGQLLTVERVNITVRTEDLRKLRCFLCLIVEVSGKAIEETAAVVLRLYHDRKQKCSMPRISKRY